MPWAVANASYKQQRDNSGVTEIVEIKNRGHALTIDSGWREVAETALGFVNSSSSEERSDHHMRQHHRETGQNAAARNRSGQIHSCSSRISCSTRCRI